jgi:hypothetical protein
MWGGGQMKCRWWWFVALLIDKSVPLGVGQAPRWRARPWMKGAPLGEGRLVVFLLRLLRVLQLGVDDKTPLPGIQRETLACLITICSL